MRQLQLTLFSLKNQLKCCQFYGTFHELNCSMCYDPKYVMMSKIHALANVKIILDIADVDSKIY